MSGGKLSPVSPGAHRPPCEPGYCPAHARWAGRSDRGDLMTDAVCIGAGGAGKPNAKVVRQHSCRTGCTPYHSKG